LASFSAHSRFEKGQSGRRRTLAPLRRLRRRRSRNRRSRRTRYVTAVSSNRAAWTPAAEAATIRLGVVGLGVMGQRLLGQVATRTDVELRAVCDIVPDRGPALPHGVRRHIRAADLLSAGDVDLLYVATPPAQHREIILAGVRAGVHVLCE